MSRKSAISKKIDFTVDDLFASDDERVYSLGFVTSVPRCKNPILDVLCVNEKSEKLQFQKMLGSIMKSKQRNFGRFNKKTQSTKGIVRINDLCVIEFNHIGHMTASGMPLCYLHNRINAPEETRSFIKNLKSTSKKLTASQLKYLDLLGTEIQTREIAGKCESAGLSTGAYEFTKDDSDSDSDSDSDDDFKHHKIEKITDSPRRRTNYTIEEITDDVIDSI